MKKKISFLLAIIMLLTGCNTAEEAEQTTAEITTTTTAETTVVTTKANSTAPVTTKVTTTTSQPLSDYISVEEYLKNRSTFQNGYFDEQSVFSLWYDGNFSLIGDGKIVGSKPANFNYISHNGMLLAGDETELLDMVVEESENATLETIMRENHNYHDLRTNDIYDNPYEFSYTPVTLDVEKCTADGSVYINDGTYSLYTEKEISVNCFIRKNGDKTELIVDPMYSYYLPCDFDSHRDNVFYYTINDVEAVTNTPPVAVDADESILSELTEEYMYCSAVLDNYTMDVFLSKPAEHSCTLKSFKIIEQNGADALTKTYFNFDSEEKSDKMSEMYDALMDIKGNWYNENCMGMTLLDLDFDEVPELLLTSICDYDNDGKIDHRTAIYRLVNGTLQYVDSFIPALGFERGDGYLTSYTDENGNKKWYVGMRTTKERKIDGYYQPVDSYVRGFMTLGEHSIEFEEIFSYWEEDIEVPENTYVSPVLFYMGEPFSENADIYEAAVAHQAEQYSSYQLEWSAQYVFSKRLNKEAHYFVSNDFIYDAYIYSALIPQTERMLAYNLAKVVDDGFLGEYYDGNNIFTFGGAYAKPVIYLYPEEETDVSIQVDFMGNGELTCTYPEYDNGWNVTAMPDGTLYDKDGNEYYCLYWEGEGEYNLDFSEGFCVKGEDTVEFLREKLMYMGLTAREANEFIIYWLPIMQKNPYNIITFHTDDYVNAVPLTVSPKPDSTIRVFMTFRASNSEVAIPIQTLPQYERNGFTVVEWGGGEIK